MSFENNKLQVDIENLIKQNVNDLSAIKELYRKLNEIQEKISQIKYIDNALVKKLKNEYENLKKIILDENIQIKLTNDIETISTKLSNDNVKLTNDIKTINLQMDTKTNKSDLQQINARITGLTVADGDVSKNNELLGIRNDVYGYNRGTAFTRVDEIEKDVKELLNIKKEVGINKIDGSLYHGKIISDYITTTSDYIEIPFNPSGLTNSLYLYIALDGVWEISKGIWKFVNSDGTESTFGYWGRANGDYSEDTVAIRIYVNNNDNLNYLNGKTITHIQLVNSADLNDKCYYFEYSTNSKLIDDIKKMDIQENTVWENIVEFDNNNIKISSDFNPVKNTDGSCTMQFTATNDRWIYFAYKLPEQLIVGNSYYIAFDMSLDIATQIETNDSTSGNLTFANCIPTSSPTSTNNKIGTSEAKDNIITTGNRKNIKFLFNITSTASNEYIILQPIKVTAGNTFKMTIYNICVSDLGSTQNVNYNNADILFEEYGYSSSIEKTMNIKAKKSDIADVALVAKTVENLDLGKGDIEIWGDSLVAQNYGSSIATILGRKVTTRGYGGKKSSYIRDKFLEIADTNKTIIINVGRNNYGKTDTIINDIRIMVNSIPHNRFLICCPPSGGYTSEFKDSGSSYHYFTELEERLKNEYQHHFLNTRLSSIHSYDMGGIRLLSSFTQPSVGGTVQILVSDTSFLTTYNDKDTTLFGKLEMEKIRIGESFSSMDVYSVISVDSPTTMTVKLEETNRISVGETVANLIDDGGLNSIIYLKVIQNADYLCWIHEITASTYRSDSIHMSDYGKSNIAKNVARTVTVLNI